MNNITAIRAENNQAMSYGTLIPVRFGLLGGEVTQLCNARDLYICLGVTTRFNDWVSRRVAEYGFVDGQDFYSEMSKKAKGQKGRNSVDYTFSVDMAKELSMVERTDAGRNIRRYFIDCEKQLRQIAPEVAAECLRKALSPKQQESLSTKVHSKVACLDKARRRAGYSELWSNLKARHQVAQYRDIPQEEFEDACSFVESYEWEGEWLGKEEAKDGVFMSGADLYLVYFLCRHFDALRKTFESRNLYAHFNGVGSPVGAEMIDHFVDGSHASAVLMKHYAEPMDDYQRTRGLNHYCRVA